MVDIHIVETDAQPDPKPVMGTYSFPTVPREGEMISLVHDGTHVSLEVVAVFYKEGGDGFHAQVMAKRELPDPRLEE